MCLRNQFSSRYLWWEPCRMGILGIQKVSRCYNNCWCYIRRILWEWWNSPNKQSESTFKNLPKSNTRHSIWNQIWQSYWKLWILIYIRSKHWCSNYNFLQHWVLLSIWNWYLSHRCQWCCYPNWFSYNQGWWGTEESRFSSNFKPSLSWTFS